MAPPQEDQATGEPPAEGSADQGADAYVGRVQAGRPVPSEARGNGRVIAIANQKGGVGKSTTAVNLGACLAEAGRRILVVDLDPQGNASTGLGIDHTRRTASALPSS